MKQISEQIENKADEKVEELILQKAQNSCLQLEELYLQNDWPQQFNWRLVNMSSSMWKLFFTFI